MEDDDNPLKKDEKPLSFLQVIFFCFVIFRLIKWLYDL